MTSFEIHRLAAGDEDAVRAAGHLFDNQPDPEATRRFLREPNHHLLIAYDSTGNPLGFVSGVETTHPDKGTEMLLYELAVDAPVRRRGIARALVQALEALARERGCYGMYVFADHDNQPARATYASAGGRSASRPWMVEWRFGA